LVAWVNLEGAIELSKRAVEVAVLAEDTSAVDVADSRLKAHVFQVGLIAKVFRLLEQGLSVVLVGRIPVLMSLGVLALFIPRFCRLRVSPCGVDEGAGEKDYRKRQSGARGEFYEDYVLAATHSSFACVLYTVKSEAFAGVHACPSIASGEDAAREALP